MQDQDTELLLAIDQSITSSGICIFSLDGELQHHTIVGTDKKDYEGLDTPVFYRASKIAEQVNLLMETFNIKHFCIEGLAMGNVAGNSNRDLAILQGMIMQYVIKKVSPQHCKVVSPTAVKKFGSGNGRAKKDEMYDSLPPDIRDEFSFYKKTKGRYDVTDAFFIGKYYLSS